MDRRSAEMVAQIMGGTPVEISPGNWQIAMPDEDGQAKLLNFENDDNDAGASTRAPA